MSVCLQDFCKGYLRRGLMQGDTIWQDDRPWWIAGLPSPLWWTLAQRLACPRSINEKICLVDRLHDQAEILLDGRSRWVAGHLPFWWILAQGLARPRSKGQHQNFDSKYLENSDRYEVIPGALDYTRTHGLLIGAIRFDLGWPWRVKNQGHTFWHKICQEQQQLQCWT